MSYLESASLLQYEGGPPGLDGLPKLPEELTRYDVILLADGGVVDLNVNASLMLTQFADLGRRVVVIASPAMGESVLHANRILDSLGMHMVDRDVDFGPVVPGVGIPSIEIAKLEPDQLLGGVTKLTTFRPAPIQIRDPNRAKILAYLPGSPDGFIAVSREGNGELVAIGLTLLPDWIGERGQGTDDAGF